MFSYKYDAGIEKAGRREEGRRGEKWKQEGHNKLVRGEEGVKGESH
jgi:hypothetical protein